MYTILILTDTSLGHLIVPQFTYLSVIVISGLMSNSSILEDKDETAFVAWSASDTD